MAHKSTALQVAGRSVRLVVVDNRLYVPLRFLIEETLDMRWEGQRKRLSALAQRWKTADLLVAGQRRVVQQPCLPVGMLLPYLWLLRPTRPETQSLLERLRDGWDAAFAAWLGIDGDALSGVGTALMAEVERALLPLIEERARLEARLAEWREVNPHSGLAKKRWKNGKKLGRAEFLQMAEMNSAGKPASEIAKALECSRTTVSLFLGGKYRTGDAGQAFSDLRNSGWTRSGVTCGM